MKNVGVTSQRKIEDKARLAVSSSKVSESKTIKISAKLLSEELDLNEIIEGEIEIEI